jgi:hypothetical protein
LWINIPICKWCVTLSDGGVTGVWQTALAHIRTDWLLWGQADLESDPLTDIPALLRAYEPGVDAIAGWRQQRGDGKVLASTLANQSCHQAFGLNIHDMNWIKLIRREALMAVPIERTTHRFLLAALAGLGYRVIETPTPWHPRFAGESKFGKKRLLTSARDFLGVLSWFYIERRLRVVTQAAISLHKSTGVALKAAKNAFSQQMHEELQGLAYHRSR